MQCTKAIQVKLTLFLLFQCTVFHVFADEWTLEKSSGTTEIFSRHVSENGQIRETKEVWAKTQLKGSLTSLLVLLDDVKRAPQWIANCIEVKLLSGADSNSKIVQSTFSAPWPLHNRDMVTESITHIESDKISIQITDVGMNYPIQENTVRMTQIHGEWQVLKISDEIVEISYQGTGNASGNVPAWLTNKVLIDSTYTTFMALNKVLVEENINP